MFYTSSNYTSINDYTPALTKDYRLCSDLSFVVKDFLSYPYENFQKIRGYIGFESGGACEAPAQYQTLFNEMSESYKCDAD